MRRRSPAYQDINPSEMALEIVDQVLAMPDRMLLLARSGSHEQNPYHNTVHELQHLFWSWACFINSVPTPGEHVDAIHDIALASLFHDHNHSGGRSSDLINIGRAVNFASRQLDAAERVIRLIEVTTFDQGVFPIEPTTYGQKCMRDADLMSIYSDEGRRLLKGLFQEMSGKHLADTTEDELREALSRNENFLFKQELFTLHGNRMRDEHLLSSLKKFEEYMWRQYGYEHRKRTFDDE